MSKRPGDNPPTDPDHFAVPSSKLRRTGKGKAVPGAQATLTPQPQSQNVLYPGNPGASQQLTPNALMELETYYTNEESLSTTSSDWSMEVCTEGTGQDDSMDIEDPNPGDPKPSPSTDVHHPLK